MQAQAAGARTAATKTARQAPATAFLRRAMRKQQKAAWISGNRGGPLAAGHGFSPCPAEASADHEKRLKSRTFSLLPCSMSASCRTAAVNSRGTQPEKTRKQQKLPHKQGGVAVQQGRSAHKACSGTQEKPAPRQQSEKLNSRSQGQHEAPCPKKGAVRRQPDHRLARRHNAQAAIRGGKHAFSRQNSHAARHSLAPHQRAPLAVQHTPGPGQALGSVGCFHTVGLNFQQP